MIRKTYIFKMGYTVYYNEKTDYIPIYDGNTRIQHKHALSYERLASDQNFYSILNPDKPVPVHPKDIRVALAPVGSKVK